MSVIIRGGRMPSGCGMCVMSRYFFSTGTTVCMLTLATLAENYTVASSDRRHEDCPLVELPEKHGRLIDASELKETLAYYIAEAGWGPGVNEVLGWVKEFIDSEHTIAEAEDGE